MTKNKRGEIPPENIVYIGESLPLKPMFRNPAQQCYHPPSSLKSKAIAETPRPHSVAESPSPR